MCYDKVAANTALVLAHQWDADLGQSVFVESLKPSLSEFRAQQKAEKKAAEIEAGRQERALESAGVDIHESGRWYREDDYKTDGYYWEHACDQSYELFRTEEDARYDAFIHLYERGEIQAPCEKCGEYVVFLYPGSVSDQGHYCSVECSEGL